MSVKIDLEIYGHISKAKKAQLRIKYMPIKTFEELKDKLIKAKIQIKKEERFYKSYFSNDEFEYFYDFVLWIEREGFITMTYDIDDDPNKIKKFMNNIEKATGEKLFFDTQKGAETKIDELNPPQEYFYQTKFTDKNIVEQLLKENNIKPKITNNSYQFDLIGFSISLYKTNDGNYELKAIGKGNTNVIEKTLGKMTNAYDKIIQNNICENIKSKVAKSSTMKLVQEEVLEDNSVLLTIRV